MYYDPTTATYHPKPQPRIQILLSEPMSSEVVLVRTVGPHILRPAGILIDAQLTGVTGYAGSHVLVHLLKEGYRVRG